MENFINDGLELTNNFKKNYEFQTTALKSDIHDSFIRKNQVIEQPKEPEQLNKLYTLIGPQPQESNENEPTEETKNADNENNWSSESDYKEQQELFQGDYKSLRIPCSHEVWLKGHTKAITCLAIDSKGNRLLSGSYDQNCRFWDFNYMTRTMNSFKILTPNEGYPINSISFCPANVHVLYTSPNNQAKIYSREGKHLLSCITGDMYLKDMKHTKGHIQLINQGCFNPANEEQFATVSDDSTVRTWNIHGEKMSVESLLVNTKVIRCNDSRGQKTAVKQMVYSKDGKLIFVMPFDGSLQGFDFNSKILYRPQFQTQNAHNVRCEGTGLAFFNDNFKFLSRSMDNSMKIWDIRSFKKPLNAWYNLSNRLPGAKVMLSPDEKYIVTGTSVNPDLEQKYSQLIFYDAQTFEQKAKITLGESSITDILWNRDINQIIVGQGNGEITAFYDVQMSKKGAMQCITRQPRKEKVEDNAVNNSLFLIQLQMCDIILDPLEYPEIHFGEPRKKKKTFTEIRNDPVQSKLPVQPYRKQDRGGRLGVTNTVSQNLMRNLYQIADSKKEDSLYILIYQQQLWFKIKSITRYCRYCQEQYLIYAKFDLISEEHMEQKILSGIKKICAACGKKVCNCGLKRYI